MQIIKGLDRIAFVIALVALIPGFVLGAHFVDEKLKSYMPEYAEWTRKVDSRRDLLASQSEEQLKSDFTPQDILEIYLNDEILEQLLANEPTMPTWQVIFGGLLGSILSFSIIFFGLRGLTRGIKKSSLWIADGFRD
jgi:hypothetical protein